MKNTKDYKISHQNYYFFSLFICSLFFISRIVQSGLGLSIPHTE